MNNRPTIVCLCGSTRFAYAFKQANFTETLKGNIVLSIGVNMRDSGDAKLLEAYTPDQRESIKANLDELHLRKIDLADEILVLNVENYVGDSTRREIEYARKTGKRVRWLNEGRNS
jgi:hypothetical protein